MVSAQMNDVVNKQLLDLNIDLNIDMNIILILNKTYGFVGLVKGRILFLCIFVCFCKAHPQF